MDDLLTRSLYGTITVGDALTWAAAVVLSYLAVRFVLRWAKKGPSYVVRVRCPNCGWTGSGSRYQETCPTCGHAPVHEVET